MADEVAGQYSISASGARVMMVEYETLREANNSRQSDWHAGQLPLTFRTNELAGECGEVADLLLDRWGIGSRFVEQWKNSLAEELSDVIICSDLIGWMLGRPLHLHVLDGLAQSINTDMQWSARMLRDVGLLCNLAKKVDRGVYAIAGGISLEPSSVMLGVTKVAQHAFDLAFTENIDMGVAIARKFNKTSAKNGLQTLYIPPGYDRAILIP